MNKALIGSVVVLSLFLNSGWSLFSNKETAETSSQKGVIKMPEMSVQEAEKKLQEADKLLKRSPTPSP